MKRVLINASNLHVGGGVQVAASFILELSRMLDGMKSFHVSILASSEVDANLISSGFRHDSLCNYSVFDVHGLGALSPNVSKMFYGYDLVFTIFGPLYLLRKIKNHIVGFAQLWILCPDNEISRRFSRKKRILQRLKFAVQWFFFNRSMRLVVELQHVKVALLALKGLSSDRVEIVNNCVSSVYFDKDRWLSIAGLSELRKDSVKIGYVSRDYPHKNLDLLPLVARELRRVSNINYEFFVTLTESEWSNRSVEFREVIVNVGPISVAECPYFYDSMDAVFFSSFLECFSATPLEAMVMKRPLFASDRGFVRDCCGDNAIYFNPLNAVEAAKCIDDWFCRKDDESRCTHVEKAYRHVMSLPGSKDRALAYIEIIKKQLDL